MRAAAIVPMHKQAHAFRSTREREHENGYSALHRACEKKRSPSVSTCH